MESHYWTEAELQKWTPEKLQGMRRQELVRYQEIHGQEERIYEQVQALFRAEKIGRGMLLLDDLNCCVTFFKEDSEAWLRLCCKCTRLTLEWFVRLEKFDEAGSTAQSLFVEESRLAMWLLPKKLADEEARRVARWCRDDERERKKHYAEFEEIEAAECAKSEGGAR